MSETPKLTPGVDDLRAALCWLSSIWLLLPWELRREEYLPRLADFQNGRPFSAQTTTEIAKEICRAWGLNPKAQPLETEISFPDERNT